MFVGVVGDGVGRGGGAAGTAGVHGHWRYGQSGLAD